jgi:hypothetical protein
MRQAIVTKFVGPIGGALPNAKGNCYVFAD